MLGYKEQIKCPLKHTRRSLSTRKYVSSMQLKYLMVDAVKRLFQKLFATIHTDSKCLIAFGDWF